MPKKPPKDGPTKLRPDAAEIAYRVMMEAAGQAPKSSPPGRRREKNKVAVARGRQGGVKGGNVRADNLDAGQRRQIARDAANVRWKSGLDGSA